MSQTTKNAEAKEVKKKINEIVKAIKEFKSVELYEIFEQYKSKGITLISDKIDGGYAYYNEEMKMVTINRDFMNKVSKNYELEYILLHEYFHHFEKQSSYLAKDTTFKEYADLYAINVFRLKGVKVPEKFRAKI